LKTKLLNFFFHADLNRKKPLIQPNRSAEFFCANLRKPFFTPPRRIRRKKTLIYLRDFSVFRRGGLGQSSLICIPQVYLPSAGKPTVIQGPTRRGGSVNFC